MLGNLFGSLASKIAATALLALFMVLGVVMWRADQISGQRDDYRDQLALCNANHAVTRGSLHVLEQEMADAVHAGELRAERLERAHVEQEKESEALLAEADRVKAEGRSEDCATPSSVMRARGL